MPEEDTFDQQNYNIDRALELRPSKPYNLRVPVDEAAETSSARLANNQEGDSLRIMPPELTFKIPIQPLSLSEKKMLYEFWLIQWKAFKDSPACQNISEKRLREKFDGYVSINIRRYLIEDWNNTFAGRYVLDEPEPRQERDPDDLRELTKRWGWLCKEMGFKPWSNAVDDHNENLENVKVDVRGRPFDLTGKEIIVSYMTGDDTNEQGGVALTVEDRAVAQGSTGIQTQFPQEPVNNHGRAMENVRKHYQELRAGHESELLKHGIMRNHPHFMNLVLRGILDEIDEIEEQGCLSFELAQTTRMVVHQEMS